MSPVRAPCWALERPCRVCRERPDCSMSASLLMLVTATYNIGLSDMASPPGVAAIARAGANIPTTHFDRPIDAPWALTQSNSFDQHFQAKYPPGFLPSLEVYDVSAPSPEPTDFTQTVCDDLPGALAPSTPPFAKRASPRRVEGGRPSA